MREKEKQPFREYIKNVTEIPRKSMWKYVYFGGLFIGFFIFFFLDKNILINSRILNIDSLRRVKDAVIIKEDYFAYILQRRGAILTLLLLIWWWGYGKMACFIGLGGLGFTMGACLQTCLLRYKIKGFLLWLVLYLPHMLFYFAAIAVGLVLFKDSYGAFGTKEKARLILDHIGLWLVLLLFYGFGIYCESFLSVSLLQNFLRLF